MNKAGHFNDANREYRIDNMYPKRLWLNYLWNECFIAGIDQFGCGQSWHRDAKAERTNLTHPKNCRLIFIRDDKTKEFWAANRNFEKASFDEFYTNVGLGYSEIVSSYRKIKTTFKMLVPTKGNYECWRVEIENKDKAARKISLFAYADLDANITCHAAYSGGRFDKALNGVFLTHSAFDVQTQFKHLFFAADKKVDAFDTTNRKFTGVYGSIQEPDAIKRGTLASEDTSFDDEMIGALQFKVNLKPGEKKQFYFIAGLSASLAESIEISKAVRAKNFFENQLDAIKAENEKAINKVYIKTPNADINSLVNIWLKQHMSLGKTWGRVYGRGFRDIMQDITGFVPLDTKTAKEKILYCLDYQYESGNTLRIWAPTHLHPYRDGACWLIPTVTGYIKETGDLDFLNAEAGYYESSLKESVLDHCFRGVNFLLSELGEHGLCIWGGGDWNDSINNVGMQLKGESVWLSQATVKATDEFAELLEKIGQGNIAKGYRNKAQVLKENILKYGWDKDHFIYGYNDWAEKIGSYDSAEGQIYLNTQAWAVLSEVVTNAKANKLMDFVEKELKCDYGYVQLKPSYTKGTDRIGRISYFQKGCYENGSVYNHGVTFKIAADCKLGRGNLAYKTIQMMLSTNPKNPTAKSGVEPYAATNMYVGPENDERAGESLFSWITGTAGWMFRSITEFIIGVQADYAGLRIDPCMPALWKEVKMTREYRGAVYDITIKNPNSIEKGTAKIAVDGQAIAGNILPIFSDNKTHLVVVNIGK